MSSFCFLNCEASSRSSCFFCIQASCLPSQRASVPKLWEACSCRVHSQSVPYVKTHLRPSSWAHLSSYAHHLWLIAHNRCCVPLSCIEHILCYHDSCRYSPTPRTSGIASSKPTQGSSHACHSISFEAKADTFFCQWKWQSKDPSKAFKGCLEHQIFLQEPNCRQ